MKLGGVGGFVRFYCHATIFNSANSILERYPINAAADHKKFNIYFYIRFSECIFDVIIMTERRKGNKTIVSDCKNIYF